MTLPIWFAMRIIMTMMTPLPKISTGNPELDLIPDDGMTAGCFYMVEGDAGVERPHFPKGSLTCDRPHGLGRRSLGALDLIAS